MPMFFGDNEGRTVTINGVHSRSMLTDYFFPQANEEGLNGMWFRQDIATCHIMATAKIRFKFVGFFFPRKRERQVLCGCSNVEHLKTNIHAAISEIILHTLENALTDWVNKQKILGNR